MNGQQEKHLGPHDEPGLRREGQRIKRLPLAELAGERGLFVDGDWVESKDQNPSGSVRLIQLADVGDGAFLNKSSCFMTPEKARELRCTYLAPGDVLIARMPDPLGRACLFPGLEQPCVTVVDVAVLRLDPRIARNDWVVQAINSSVFRNKMLGHVTGTTRQRISRGNLGQLELAVPPSRAAPHRRHSRQGRRHQAQAPGSHPPHRRTAESRVLGDVR